jgi:hypothetical protein
MVAILRDRITAGKIYGSYYVQLRETAKKPGIDPEIKQDIEK